MKKRQQGVALIMTLMFLTLMTLVSASAIQQNNLQLTMAGNTQEQSKSFSRSENFLKLAEKNIEALRWSDARSLDPVDVTTNTECKETEVGSGEYGLIEPGTTIATAEGSTAVIVAWWCENNPDDTDDDGFGEPAECFTDDDDCPIIPTSGQAPSPNTFTYNAGDVGCGTELYTVKVTYIHEQSQAERVVESKYAIRCLATGV